MAGWRQNLPFSGGRIACRICELVLENTQALINHLERHMIEEEALALRQQHEFLVRHNMPLLLDYPHPHRHYNHPPPPPPPPTNPFPTTFSYNNSYVAPSAIVPFTQPRSVRAFFQPPALMILPPYSGNQQTRPPAAAAAVMPKRSFSDGYTRDFISQLDKKWEGAAPNEGASDPNGMKLDLTLKL